MIPELCRKYYASFFDDNYQDKEELKRFFFDHERRPSLENALIEQIHGAMKFLRTTHDVKRVVYDIMLSHCNLAINERSALNKKSETRLFDEFGVERKKSIYEEPELPDEAITVDRNE